MGQNAFEKEMATHSSILAWRIPGTEEPGGLAVYGVAQGWTWLKRLRSSSSNKTHWWESSLLSSLCDPMGTILSLSCWLFLTWKVSLAGRQVELISLRVWEREAETEMELYVVGKGWLWGSEGLRNWRQRWCVVVWTVLGGCDWDLPLTTLSPLFLGRLSFLHLNIYSDWSL